MEYVETVCLFGNLITNPATATCRNRMENSRNCLNCLEDTGSLKDIKGTHSSGSASAKVPPFTLQFWWDDGSVCQTK